MAVSKSDIRAGECERARAGTIGYGRAWPDVASYMSNGHTFGLSPSRPCSSPVVLVCETCVALVLSAKAF